MIHILYKRKTDIHQKQLTDYIGVKSVEIYKTWEKGVYNEVRRKFSWVPVRQYTRKSSDKGEQDSNLKQLTLSDFMDWIPTLKGQYLYRFPKVKIPRFEDHAKGVVSQKEWDMHRYLTNFNGFFENLFELNDLSFFDDLQESLRAKGVYFKGLSVRDVFCYNLLRINLGFKDYTGIEKMSRLLIWPPLFRVTVNPEFIPTAAEMSFVLNKIPAKELFSFFRQLVRECVDEGIIVPRVLIWDGQFLRSNCNNNKDEDKGEYNDPEAGYCRHNGKKKGVGYDPGILYAYCGDRWFPIYFKMFPGNRSDQEAFKETVRAFLSETDREWQLIISDSGSYALNILEEIRFRNMLPIIRARKNIKNQPVRELKEGYYFNTDFIPPEWSEEYFLFIYSFRPMIEQGNSYNHTYYNGERMNTRGQEAAIKHVASIYILELLKALTAHKMGRPDLVMKPGAFQPSRHLNYQLVLPQLAEESGFKIFEQVGL
ncbi:MAG: transposase [Candidatus Lokiarchaeota archaeon]|nr:transposase [Candidatus Lokiarchaeota archaeon]